MLNNHIYDKKIIDYPMGFYNVTALTIQHNKVKYMY